MALLKQAVMIDQVALVGESREKGERPGHGDQDPRPEHRCSMGRRRWGPLLSLYIRNMRGLHQTPPFPFRPPDFSRRDSGVGGLDLCRVLNVGCSASKWKLPPMAL